MEKRARAWLVVVMLVAGAGPAWSLEAVADFGANPGNLSMHQHVPTGATGPLPVVVVLHGCTQDGAGYANGAGWTQLADRAGFALVVAEQKSANNQNRCFNWFESGDIARDSGEAASIRQMVAYFAAGHTVDAQRVFVTGLSAGGAMTAVMLATYPDVFAAGAVVAGVPYLCGTGVSEAFGCMNNGRTLTAQQWGDLVRGAGSHTGPWPRVSIWHGSADSTVRPVNADNLVLQWGNLLGTETAASSSDTTGNHVVRRWPGSTAIQMEDHRITGMNHGTPVNPGTGPTHCGTAGAFLLDVDVCSSLEIARFFGLLPTTGGADAGVVDAGLPGPTDAGPVGPADAGAPSADAGTRADAGARSDAGSPIVTGTRETFTATDGTDLDGWTLTGFSPDALDHTGGWQPLDEGRGTDRRRRLRQHERLLVDDAHVPVGQRPAAALPPSL